MSGTQSTFAPKQTYRCRLQRLLEDQRASASISNSSNWHSETYDTHGEEMLDFRNNVVGLDISQTSRHSSRYPESVSIQPCSKVSGLPPHTEQSQPLFQLYVNVGPTLRDCICLRIEPTSSKCAKNQGMATALPRLPSHALVRASCMCCTRT